MFTVKVIDPPMAKVYRPGEFWLKKGEVLISRLRAQFPRHSDRQLIAILEAFPATQLMPHLGPKDAEATVVVAQGLLRHSAAAAPQ